MKHTVYLSLGSNLGDREENLLKAVQILEKRAGNIISRSAFYYSEPWGFVSEHGFVNNCVCLQTEMEPEELLKSTQEIEKELGRLKKSNGNYTDRLIDIDILLFDSRVINTEKLVIPHPLMEQRAFVMEPLCEIAPEFIHPVLLKSIAVITKLLSK